MNAENVVMTAKQAVAAGQYVRIDKPRSEICVFRGASDGLFFQDRYARDLIEQAEKVTRDLCRGSEVNITPEDYILFIAQKW